MPEPGSGNLVQGTYFGLDFGLRRIGVAVGQTMTNTARPLAVVKNGSSPDWQALEKLISEWKPRAMVVGLPLASDGTQTRMSEHAIRFGKAVERRLGCTVHYNDERLTSAAAREQFIQGRASGRARQSDAALLDAMAAAIILEHWFDLQTSTLPNDQH